METLFRLIDAFRKRSLETYKLAGFGILIGTLLYNFNFTWKVTTTVSEGNANTGSNPEIALSIALIILFGYSIFVDYKLRQRKNAFREKMLEMVGKGEVSQEIKEKLQMSQNNIIIIQKELKTGYLRKNAMGQNVFGVTDKSKKLKESPFF